MKDKSLRVLIIEDSKDDVMLIIRALKKGGYSPVYEQVETAASMKKAFQEKQWDIILCDYKMPRFSAPSAIGILKEINNDIPLIIVSGAIGEDTAVECMRLGARDYILKVNYTRLCPAITRELEYMKVRNKQKRAEEELRERDVKLRHLISWVPGMIFQFTMKSDGTYCLPYASEAIREFYGCSPEDVRDDLSSIIKIILQEDLDNFLDSIEYSAQNSTNWTCEYRVQIPGKPIRWVLGNSTPEKLADGSVTWHGINTDITDRKQAEEALNNSYKRLDEIIDFLPDATFVIDLERKIITWNRSAEKITGVPKTDMIGRGNYEYAIPFYGERRPLLVDLVLLPDKVFEKNHYENISRKGDTLYAESYSPMGYGRKEAFFLGTASKLRDASGNIIGAIESIRDITKRKEAEEQLRKNEGIFRVLFNQSFHLIGLMKPDGTLLQINTKAKTFTWIREDEVLGKLFWTTPWWSHSQVEQERLKKAIKRAANGEFIRYETTYFENAGVMRHIDFSISPVKDNNGNVILLIPEGSDITDSKQAEERLSKSERKFSSTFHLTPNPMAISELITWKYIDVNQAFTNWTGYSRKEVIGFSANDIHLWVHPEHREKIISTLTVEGEINSVEVLMRQKNGNIRNTLFSARFIDTEQERYLLTLCHDITDRKLAEEALRNSHRRLDEIIDFLPDATFVIDREKKIITWNKSIEMITGVSKADMIGKGDYEYAVPFYGECRPLLVDLVLLPDDVFEKNHYENVSRQGDTLYAEAYLPMVYGGKGGFFWGTASKLLDPSGNIIGAIESFRDITERKKTENELKQIAENLEDANIALRVLMNRRDKDQREFEEKLQVNIDDLVVPYLKKLNKENLDNRNKNYIGVLEHNLSDVLSPFMRDFRSAHKNLTPREIQIVDLIKKGKDTKEIADMLNASVSTITTHRNNIRKKLNLINSKINLRSHILSFK